MNYLAHAQLYMRECQPPLDQFTTSCTLTQFYNRFTRICSECTSIWPNCASCNSTQCLLCPKGFYWNPSVWNNTQAKYVSACVFDLCPKGTCKNPFTNQCVPSTFGANGVGCTACEVINEVTNQQTCLICPVPMVKSAVTGLCQTLTPISKTYYVKAGAPSLSANYTYVQTTPQRGTNITTPFLFIQEALYDIYINQLQGFQQMSTTIYLSIGNHFFFYCDGNENQASYFNSSYVQYCNQFPAKLQRQYPIIDYQQITIKPLFCALSGGFEAGIQLENFRNMCQPNGVQVTVFVNNANTFFNITGSMQFENILFSGINALVLPTQTPAPDLSAFPLQFCQVNFPPNGYEAAFRGLGNQTSGETANFSFTCADSWYTAPQRVDLKNQKRRCNLNQNQKFNLAIESTLKCQSKPTAATYFSLSPSNYYNQRMFTLFNLYAFADYQSIYKKPPSLTLINCNFQYFFGGYDSLINVETYSLQQITYNVNWTTITNGVTTNNSQSYVFYSGYGANKGAQIMINGGSFVNNRFCRGMIFYRKPIYIQSSLSFTNYTSIYTINQNSDVGSYIAVTGASFTQMNIFTNVTAIAAYGGTTPTTQLNNANQLETLTFNDIIHKGIIVNSEDFGGQIEFVNTIFLRNMHYISEAANMPKNSSANLGMEQFRSQNINEYKMTACNENTLTDMNFFTIGRNANDDIDNSFDDMERMSVIYIARNRYMMLFNNCQFITNSGTFGGAITVDSPNFNQSPGRPFLVVQNSLFQQNQAYFSGNAIYMRNTKLIPNQPNVCGGGFFYNSSFIQNIGTKIHNGGAITAICTYLINPKHDDYNSTSSITSIFAAADVAQPVIEPLDSVLLGAGAISVYSFRFNIDTCNFTENYSGQKGSAVYISQMSKIRLYTTGFYNNGPVFSFRELSNSPFSIYMTNRAISYFDPLDQCFNEFQYINDCLPTQIAAVELPRVQGALYIGQCLADYCTNTADFQIVQIFNCDFVANNAGPNLESKFPSHNNAQSIYLLGGQNITITKCRFNQHIGQEDYYTTNVATAYGKFFPKNYYQMSHGPVIRIMIQPQPPTPITQALTYVANITLCNFTQNQNYQILGYTPLVKQYFGSLIAYETSYYTGAIFLPLITITSSMFSNNQFIGNQTALIYINQGLLNFTNNTIYGNGLLSTNVTRKPVNPILPFQPYTLYSSQQFGTLWIVGLAQFPTTLYHVIQNNLFQFGFSQKGTSITINGENQSYLLSGNRYINNFAQQGPGIYVYSQDVTRTTLILQNETFVNNFGLIQGAISLEPGQPNTLSVQIQNSSFTNCWATSGGSVYGNMIAAVLIQNTIFQDNVFSKVPIKALIISTQYQLAPSLLLFQLVDLSYLSQIVDGIVKQSGSIYLQSALNTLPINFTSTNILKTATNPFLSYSDIIDCQFENLTAYTGSAIYILQGTQLRLMNNLTSRAIKGCSQYNYGAVRVENGASIYGQSLQFIGNSVQQQGGAISIVNNASANMINTTFLNNTASAKGGAIYLNDQSTFNCSFCKFQTNFALVSSVLYGLSNENVPLGVYMNQTTFINNTHIETLMFLLGTSVLIENSYFLNNIGQTVNNGLSLLSSNLVVNNITVIYTNPQFINNNQWTVDNGFFTLNYMSNFSMGKNSTMINCRGAVTSAIYAIGQSSVNITGNTSFINGLTQPGGSTVLISIPISASIQNANFLKNSDMDVIMQKGNINIQNTQFINSNSNSINANNANVTVQNTNFINGSNTLINGKGISCTCQNLQVNNCTFRGLAATTGAGIFMTSSSPQSNFTIQKSQFINNSAQQGGAIKLQDALILSILNNTFINNSASVINPPSLLSSKLVPKGVGGAISLDCNNMPQLLSWNCSVYINKTNVFISNTAQNDGGALQYVANRYITDGTSLFVNNYAPYASNAASIPSTLNIIFQGSGSSRLLQSGFNGRQLQTPLNFPNISSGTPFSFIVQIIDMDGQIYSTDSTSSASLISSNPNVSIFGSKATAVNGIFNFSNVVIKIRPGDTTSLSLTTQGLNTNGDPSPNFGTPMNIAVQSQQCVLGDILTADDSCFQCQNNTYMLVEPKSISVSCNTCPPEASCFGRNLVGPAPGYWRSDNVTMVFLKCPNTAACQGATPTNIIGSCAPGYTGILCGNCLTGYKKQGQICTQCPTPGMNTFFFVVLLVLALLVIVIITRSIVIYDEKEVYSPYSVYLKIMVSHFQILGIMMSVQYFWPAQLLTIQNGYGYFSGINQEIFSFDCFLQNQNSQVDQTQKINMLKLVFFTVAPILLFAVVGLFWFLSSIRSKINWLDLRTKTISTTLIIFFIIHPSIARVYFQIFNCIDVNGVQRLSDDLSTICYEGNHIISIVALAMPAIFAWIIAVPIICLIILFHNRVFISKISQTSQLSKSDQHRIKELRTKYGFLFTGYTSDMFFWEIIVIYRKVFLVVLTALLATVSSETQVLTGLLILIVSLVLQVKYQPFSSQNLNLMENYSLQVVSITAYAGMFYVTGQYYGYMGGESVELFFLIIIILPNAIFFAHWLYRIRIEILMLALKKGEKWFKMLSFGLVDSEEFRQSYVLSDKQFFDVINDNLDKGHDDKDSKKKDMDDFDSLSKQAHKPQSGKHISGRANQYEENSFNASDIDKSKEQMDHPGFESSERSKDSPKHSKNAIDENRNTEFDTKMLRRLHEPQNLDVSDNDMRRNNTSQRLIDNENNPIGSRKNRNGQEQKVYPEGVLNGQRDPESEEYLRNKQIRQKRLKKSGLISTSSKSSNRSRIRGGNERASNNSMISDHESNRDFLKNNAKRINRERFNGSDVDHNDIETIMEKDSGATPTLSSQQMSNKHQELVQSNLDDSHVHRSGSHERSNDKNNENSDDFGSEEEQAKAVKPGTTLLKTQLNRNTMSKLDNSILKNQPSDDEEERKSRANSKRKQKNIIQ